MSTLQQHILETDCTILKVKKLICALGSTFTVSSECVFTEVLLIPFTPSSDVVQTLPNFYMPSQMKFCIKIPFGLCFKSAFSLTYQTPRLHRLVPQR